MLLLMVVLCWMLRTDHRVSRREGATLLAVYAVYLAGLAGLTVAAGR